MPPKESRAAHESEPCNAATYHEEARATHESDPHTRGELGFHPLVLGIYFLIVIGFTMFLLEPSVSLISLAGGCLTLFSLKGRRAGGIVFGAFAAGLAAAVINPAFNHAGTTILAYLPSGNPLTLESVVYGVCASLMLSAAVVWFGCLSEVMTSEKLVCILGKTFPSLGLLVSMTLRAIPRIGAALRETLEARRGIEALSAAPEKSEPVHPADREPRFRRASEASTTEKTPAMASNFAASEKFPADRESCHGASEAERSARNVSSPDRAKFAREIEPDAAGTPSSDSENYRKSDVFSSRKVPEKAKIQKKLRKKLTEIRLAADVFSGVLGQLIESSSQTADSMKARGWGLPGRGSFYPDRLTKRDAAALFMICFLGFMTLSGAVSGGFYFRTYPSVKACVPADGKNIALLVVFRGAFLALSLLPLFAGKTGKNRRG